MQDQIKHATWVWRIAGVAALVGLTGCSGLQNVPIDDNNAAFYAVRATLRGKPGELKQRSGAGVEIGYEGYRARDTQVLASGEVILLDGGSIAGPETLRHEAKFQQAYVAYNHLLRFGSSFELEPFVGVTQVSLKIRTDLASLTNVPMLDDRRTGIMGGLTPRWRFNDTLAVEARLGYFSASAWASGRSYEAALVMRPTANVAMRLGFSEHRYDVSAFVPDWYSKVSIRARGPLATLQFDL